MDVPRKSKFARLLRNIYGDDADEGLFSRIRQLAKPIEEKATNGSWSESDVFLITYADSVTRNGEKPLKTLHTFLDRYLSGFVSGVHILPFFPYSSDYGFSVKDYKSVHPEYGTWHDVEAIGDCFELMVDLVINHASVEHPWFLNFCENMEPGRTYFITERQDADLDRVVRPRSSPLLTPFKTAKGKKYVWTTFSEDQADLDFSNPKVLLEMLEILRLYIEKGARLIRLDAIAYLWKEKGTSCIHLPQTHEVVKLLRSFAENIHPEVLIVTETNVPHKENISYFGRGEEAHMVYQFPLPPLLLYALYSGDASLLTQWAGSLGETPPGTTFLNFTASHDGIGVRPLEGILGPEELDAMCGDMEKAGGQISKKRNEDGSESPYEINISYFDALAITMGGSDGFQEERFLCSQIIMLTLRGVPAFYFHSLTATGNDQRKFERTGVKRDLNRKNWDFRELVALLEKPSVQSSIFNALRRITTIRRSHKAFHPDAAQEIPECSNSLFVVRRSASGEVLTSISNVTSREQRIGRPKAGLDEEKHYVDLLDNKTNIPDDVIVLKPYQTLWISESPKHE